MQSIVGPARLRVDAPLARLTTFRVGGPADLLVEVHTVEELRAVLNSAAIHRQAK